MCVTSTIGYSHSWSRRAREDDARTSVCFSDCWPALISPQNRRLVLSDGIGDYDDWPLWRAPRFLRDNVFKPGGILYVDRDRHMVAYESPTGIGCWDHPKRKSVGELRIQEESLFGVEGV